MECNYHGLQRRLKSLKTLTSNIQAPLLTSTEANKQTYKREMGDIVHTPSEEKNPHQNMHMIIGRIRRLELFCYFVLLFIAGDSLHKILNAYSKHSSYQHDLEDERLRGRSESKEHLSSLNNELYTSLALKDDVIKRDNLHIHAHNAIIRDSNESRNSFDERHFTTGNYPQSKKESTQPRLLQQTEKPSLCEEQSFLVIMYLDAWPPDVSWNLVDVTTNITVARKVYEQKDAFLNVSQTFCIPESQYTFTIHDVSGNGIDCGPGSGCFQVFLDNQIILMGSKFSDSIRFAIDSSSPCPASSTFKFRLKQDPEDLGFTWELFDSTASEIHPLRPYQDNDVQFPSSYFACIYSGDYAFEILSTGPHEVVCGEEDDCYQISINGEYIATANHDKPGSPTEISYGFFINNRGDVVQRQCPKTPKLSPSNDVNNFVHDQRISEMLDMFYTLSSIDGVQNPETSEYKAACFMIFDDTMKLNAFDPHFTERFAVAVFLFSTEFSQHYDFLTNGVCDHNQKMIECNNEGFVTKIAFSKS